MGIEIERTAYGLRETLFDAIEGVLNGTMGRPDARVIASLSARVLDTVKMEVLEIEMLRLTQEIERGIERAQITDGEIIETTEAV